MPKKGLPNVNDQEKRSRFALRTVTYVMYYCTVRRKDVSAI